jgi:hypothetical protein
MLETINPIIAFNVNHATSDPLFKQLSSNLFGNPKKKGSKKHGRK